MSGVMGLEDIPEHVLGHMLTLLSPIDVACFSLINKRFKDLATDDAFWKRRCSSACGDTYSLCLADWPVRSFFELWPFLSKYGGLLTDAWSIENANPFGEKILVLLVIVRPRSMVCTP